jgi:hypothetical protein
VAERATEPLDLTTFPDAAPLAVLSVVGAGSTTALATNFSMAPTGILTFTGYVAGFTAATAGFSAGTVSEPLLSFSAGLPSLSRLSVGLPAGLPAGPVSCSVKVFPGST